MRECLDEGILQTYFDGELSRGQMESVTSHSVVHDLWQRRASWKARNLLSSGT